MKETRNAKKDGSAFYEQLRNDRALFSSLVKHVVQSAPNEDPTDFVLSAIGKSVGADRCCVYRFWDPGKTSMCTNTHEWCAEGIKPEISGRQACNLADLVEFNAHIMSGRDFLFTDINDIDAGSREWLAPQGIKSLIATPLVRSGNKICGFVGFDFVKAQCKEFTERIILNIHEAADILVNCQRLHEGDAAMQDVLRGRNEYEKNEREFERALLALQKDASADHIKQMLEIVRDRMDADICYMVQDIHPKGGGIVLPEHVLARDGWTNSHTWTIDNERGRAFDTRLMISSVVTFRGDELAWVRENAGMEGASSELVSGIKAIHSFGVRKEGQLVGVLCVGYDEDSPLSTPLTDFLRRAAFVIVTTLERIATYHDLTIALNVAHLKGEIVEFMFRHQDYEEVKEFLCSKVCEVAGAQHLMLCSDDGSRSDWFGVDAPECCHTCAKTSSSMGKKLPQEFFADSETVIIAEGDPLPDMNLPRYCPLMSSVVAQFKKGNGWWRLVADYTKPHRHNMNEVARGLRTALEFLAISYDRECREKTISKMQEHQRFRADALAFALANDDLPGLIDLMLHRLLELTECDYIAIHSVDGDHRLLYPNEELKACPHRCEACSFYKLHIPPVEDADHVVELNDAKGQTVADLPTDCPAKSLEVVVVYCEGKPWGGIALHYVDRQNKISDYDRATLKTAANVLTMALERHSAAVRLEAERDRVIEAEKTRSYFFSAVSHDIRTPLNAIIGFSELLQAGGVPPEEMKQDLNMIVTSGKTLLQLINDVLDLSKMDLGKLEFNYEPTDVGALVRELLPMFSPMARGKNQTIVTEIPELPRFMLDPHRFRQVLFNFVGNAVKYAGPCTIRVSVVYEDGLLKLTVADNGKGVSEEKAKRLMQPFVQANIKDRTEGSGLGLAICKRLVELANGTISIDTAPGKGFAVHAEVKVALAPVEAPSSESDSSTPDAEQYKLPTRILVVDDSPVNRAVLRAMLKKIGVADIELVENGKAALDMLEKDSAFDLVMSDMWMPVMDGIELIKNIRANERLSKLNVCSITADVEARTTYKEQGFDSFLLKPVTIEKLMTLFKTGRQRQCHS